MKENAEEWRALCALAAVEQDPAKLLKLIERINALLVADRSGTNEKKTEEDS